MDLFGRDSLLAHARAIVDAAIASSRNATVAFSAGSGYGKSAVLNAIAGEYAARANVVTLRATAIEPRSQEVPLLRPLLAAAWPTLSQAYPEHVAGLELVASRQLETIDDETLVLGFARLCEALRSDVPVVIALDDAQWLDTLTLAALESVARASAHCPAIILLASRTEALPRFREVFAPMQSIAVNELDDAAIKLIAHRYYPDAIDDVIETIAQCSGGVAIEAVALAQQAASANASSGDHVAKSFEVSIASSISAMAHDYGSLLQACSLMRAPISYASIRALAPGTAVDFLQSVTPRYLTQNEDGFEFSHQRIREGVEASIRVRAPLQQRVLEMLTSREALSLHELLDAVDASAALGRTDDRYTLALRAANSATDRLSWELAAKCFQNALDADANQFLSDALTCRAYCDVLRLLERHEEARALLTKALARRTKVENGTGVLVSALANVAFSIDGIHAALAVCAHFAESYEGDMDRTEIKSTELSLRIQSGETSVVDDPVFARIIDQGPRNARIRLLVGRSLRNALEGNASDATADLARIEILGADQHLGSNFNAATRLAVQALIGGPASIVSMLQSLPSDASPAYRGSMYAIASLCDGNWSNALERLCVLIDATRSGSDRDALLAAAAAIIALGGENDQLDRLVNERANQLLDSPLPTESTEILLWRSLKAGSWGARAVPAIVAWLQSPRPLYRVSPVEFAVALLERTHGALPIRFTERSPWLCCLHDFRSALHAGSSEALMTAAARLDSFGARALGAFTRDIAKRGKNVARLRLTSREKEVCGLVCDGLTNRAIAEHLFLSERTVATHVANAFAKLGASNRTELSRKYLAD